MAVNVVSMLAVLLLIMDKLSLTKMEKILVFSKVEYIIYFATLLEYVIHINVLIQREIKFQLAFILPFVTAVIALVNYLCLKSSFYNKLRIRARISIIN
jgi:hypothetical protein